MKTISKNKNKQTKKIQTNKNFICEKKQAVEHVFMRVVRDCHGRDVVALLCPARTSVLELLLRALGILEEF